MALSFSELTSHHEGSSIQITMKSLTAFLDAFLVRPAISPSDIARLKQSGRTSGQTLFYWGVDKR